MRFTVDDDLQQLALATNANLTAPVTEFQKGAIWALARVVGVDPIVLEARFRQMSGPVAAPSGYPDTGVPVAGQPAVLEPAVQPPQQAPIGTAMGPGLPAPGHPDQVGYYPMLGPIVSFGEDQPEADLTQPPAAPVKGMADEWREAVAAPDPDPALLPMDDETLAEVEAEIAAASARQYDPADPEIAALAAQAGVTLPPG